MVIFYKTVTFFPSEQKYAVKELIKWLNDVRALIVYDYSGEEILTSQFLHILLVLFVLGVFLRFKENDKKGFFSIIKRNDVLVIPLLVALIQFFVVPNGSGAGMMSVRYCFIVYILGLIWVITQPIPKIVGRYVVLLVLVLHFGLLFKHLNGTIKNLDKNAIIVNQTANYIKENSIILPVNLSDNWLEPHFSNYLGVDKPMIILENYEASVGWFPIKWNTEKMPNILLGCKTSISGIQWISNSKSMNIRQIDNILLYGNTNKINDPNWKELKEVLSSDFRLKYNSENNYAMLYEKLH